MIGCAAVLDVVIMIRAQVRVHAAFPQQFGHGIVEWLERAPRRVQKIQPARVQFPARGHAGQRTDVIAVKRDRSLRKPRKIRQRDAVRAVVRQQVAPQRIEHHQNRAHQAALLLPDLQLLICICHPPLPLQTAGLAFIIVCGSRLHKRDLRGLALREVAASAAHSIARWIDPAQPHPGGLHTPMRLPRCCRETLQIRLLVSCAPCETSGFPMLLSPCSFFPPVFERVGL